MIETQTDIAAAELKPATVMRRVVERTQRLSGADAAVIDAVEGDETVHVAASGGAEGCVGRRLKINASLTGLALRQQTILRCDDTETDPRVDREACRKFGTRSMVVVPLVHNGVAVGLLRVLSLRPFAFSESHVACLRMMAGVVTSTLKNAIDMEEKRRLLAQRDAALAELREQEQRFRLAFDHAPIGMALLGPHRNWLRVNRTLCQLLGYGDAELLATSPEAVLHEDDRPAFRTRCARMIDRAGTASQAQRRFLHRGGRVVWALTGLSLARDANGRPAHFIWQVLDVTERRLAQIWDEDRALLLERIAQDASAEDVLGQLAEMVARQLPGVTVTILLLRDGTIRPIGNGLPDGMLAALDRHGVSLAAALASHPVGQEPAMVLSDLTADAAWSAFREPARAAGLAGCWSVPARLPDDTFVALLLAFTWAARTPTEEQTRLLRAAAKLAAVAVERAQARGHLAHLATHDVLTGLPHRAVFEDRLQQAIALARRKGHLVAVLAVDLDHFKAVNDTLGHAAGDELLRQAAGRLRAVLRESDTVARLGGDEFAILLPELRDFTLASRVAGKVVTELARPFAIGSTSLTVTGSIGIGVCPTHATDAAAVQKAADDALYQAKRSGRNGFTVA
ncbi:MAG TPA: diguanylate cyclase [Tepidisphaeraceae bacterium]